MSDSLRPKRSWTVPALAVCMFACGIAGAVDRKALVPLLVIACVPLVSLAGAMNLKVVFRLSPLIAGAGVFTVWAATTNIWGYDVHLGTLAQVVITVVLGVLASRGVAALPEDAASALDRWIIAGSCVLVVFLTEERLSGARVSALLHPDPAYQVSTFHYPRIFDFAGGGAAVLAPTCFAVAVLMHVRLRCTVCAALYIVAAFVACAEMPMAAAALAIILGGAAFAVAYFFPRLTFTGIFTGLTLYLLIAPVVSLKLIPTDAIPLPTMSSQAFSEQDNVSERARLGIWRHVAELITEAPVIGHGFGASRDLSATNEQLAGTEMAAIPIHPHNGVLQVWLELGGVGALIIAGMLAAAWRATACLWSQPLAAATVAGTLVASAIPILLSFSLWNTWWLATLGFTAIFAVRAVNAASVRSMP